MLCEDLSDADVPLTVLETAAVGLGNLQNYEERMAEFKQQTLKRRKLARTNPQKADLQALAHVLWLCGQRRSAAEGMKFIAALGH